LQCHGAKVGEKWGGDYYLFVPVIPSASIIERHRLRAATSAVEEGTEELHDPRRAGADIGIPTMTGKMIRARGAGQGCGHHNSER